MYVGNAILGIAFAHVHNRCHFHNQTWAQVSTIRERGSTGPIQFTEIYMYMYQS